MQDSKGLVDLSGEGLAVLEQVEELRVVHLQQHASNLASQLRLRSTINRLAHYNHEKTMKEN